MLTGVKVSIIVPIYKGKKYIKRLLEQIGRANEHIAECGCVTELVLVNDYPEETIDDMDMVFDDVEYPVVVINNSVNKGIHGARLAGIASCTGEYIVMLDQDDKIFPEYLHSQLDSIGDNEAVVCRLIHEDRVYYNDENKFDDAMNMDYMLKNGCPIVSPGQVMIKKSVLPELWIDNMMIHNGADDFLLWLLLLNQGASFALNQQVVFEHTIEYDNNSWNSLDMIASEREMIRILKSDSHFLHEYSIHLDELENQLFVRRINQLDKFKKMFFVYDGILKAKHKGKTIAKYMDEHNFKRVAVFGYGYVGKLIIREIEDNNGGKIEYVIDRNADYIMDEVCAYKLENSLPDVDCIIVSLVQHEETICNILGEKTNAHVISIKKMLVGMLGKDKYAAFEINR